MVARPGVAGPGCREGWTEGLEKGRQDLEVLPPICTPVSIPTDVPGRPLGRKPCTGPTSLIHVEMRKGGPERLNGLVEVAEQVNSRAGT